MTWQRCLDNLFCGTYSFFLLQTQLVGVKLTWLVGWATKCKSSKFQRRLVNLYTNGLQILKGQDLYKSPKTSLKLDYHKYVFCLHSFIPYFLLLVFGILGHFSCMIFFPVFCNKDYVIFSFSWLRHQKWPKMKNGMNEKIDYRYISCLSLHPTSNSETTIFMNLIFLFYFGFVVPVATWL